LLHECRPDAWIYQTKTDTPFSILVESKVGNNVLTNAQVFRHLIGDQGFNQDTTAVKGFMNSPKRIISTTWDEINRALAKMDNKICKHPVCSEIVFQFTEYMKASGEVLDLTKLNKEYDAELAKRQFQLFLVLLDKHVCSKWKNLSRAERSLNGLWDYYGIKGKDGKVKKNPHISIHFSEYGVRCAFTISEKKLSKKRVEKIRDGYADFNEYLSTILKESSLKKYRFYINLLNFRLIDHKQGQMRGDRYDSFSFKVNFAELAKSKKNLDDIYNTVIDCLPLAKQFEIYYECSWVDFNKVTKNEQRKLRSENKKLIINPGLLAKEMTEFINKLMPILNSEN
jgi:hypothetical protein